MTGQLRFDEVMNISEDKQQETKECEVWRTPMVDPCYYCLCNSCINNAENIKVDSNEIPDDWKPCYFCDDCRIFDGNTAKKNMEREQCSRYEIDNHHAEQKRRKFTLL